MGFTDEIGADNVFVHADSYQMNIEEAGFKQAIRQAGPKRAYIHISESARGVSGYGNAHRDDVFDSLAGIEYQGPLVHESFAAANPDLAGATCMWRAPYDTSGQQAREGVVFLREAAARAGLP
jgi:D-psicose/D-tagatose/L-ribulose 3-epimerase